MVRYGTVPGKKKEEKKIAQAHQSPFAAATDLGPVNPRSCDTHALAARATHSPASNISFAVRSRPENTIEPGMGGRRAKTKLLDQRLNSTQYSRCGAHAVTNSMAAGTEVVCMVAQYHAGSRSTKRLSLLRNGTSGCRARNLSRSEKKEKKTPQLRSNLGTLSRQRIPVYTWRTPQNSETPHVTWRYLIGSTRTGLFILFCCIVVVHALFGFGSYAVDDGVYIAPAGYSALRRVKQPRARQTAEIVVHRINSSDNSRTTPASNRLLTIPSRAST